MKFAANIWFIFNFSTTRINSKYTCLNPLLLSIGKCTLKRKCNVDCGKTVSVMPSFNKILPFSRSQKFITTDLGLKTVIIGHTSVSQRVSVEAMLNPDLSKK